MRHSVIKFGAVVAALAVLAAAIARTPQRDESLLTVLFLIFIFLGIPLLILTWVDLGHSLRSVSHPSRAVYILGVIFAVPQVLFATVAILCGVTLLCWVLYNSLIRRFPQYSGGFLTFGLGPALISFGVLWLRQSLSRTLSSQDDASRSNNRSRGP
jgi:uncharacterized membrane protein YwaF